MKKNNNNYSSPYVSVKKARSGLLPPPDLRPLVWGAVRGGALATVPPPNASFVFFEAGEWLALLVRPLRLWLCVALRAAV